MGRPSSSTVDSTTTTNNNKNNSNEEYGPIGSYHGNHNHNHNNNLHQTNHNDGISSHYDDHNNNDDDDGPIRRLFFRYHRTKPSTRIPPSSSSSNIGNHHHRHDTNTTVPMSETRIRSFEGRTQPSQTFYDEYARGCWDRRSFVTMGGVDWNLSVRNLPIRNDKEEEEDTTDGDGTMTTTAAAGASTRTAALIKPNEEEDPVTTDIRVASTRTTFVCTVPPGGGSKWSASFGGTSIVRNRVLDEGSDGGVGRVGRGRNGSGNALGCTETNVSLGYGVGDGMDLVWDWSMAGGGRSKVSYGALVRGASSLTRIKLHNLRSCEHPTALSIGYDRRLLNDKLYAVVEFGILAPFLHLARTGQIPNKQRRTENGMGSSNPVPLRFFRLGLSTTHGDRRVTYDDGSNDSEPSLSTPLPDVRLDLDWGVDKLPLKLWYNIRPQRQFGRATEFYLAFGYGGRFDATALVNQPLTPSTSLGVGMGMLSQSLWSWSTGPSWILRLKSGTFCCNIPVRLWNGGPCSTMGDFWIRRAVEAYLAFWTATIHLVVRDWICGGDSATTGNDGCSMEEEDRLRTERDALIRQREYSRTVARNDAKSQTLLMKRKAESNRKAEEEKNGLVIVSAMYGVEGGDTMDATVQLQFWVTDSRLRLAATSKSGMLGFYNLVDTSQDRTESGVDEGSVSWGLGGLVSLWKHLFQQNPVGKSGSNGKNNTYLAVRYRFDERLYDVIVRDNEALVLPSPRAMEVKNVL